MNVSKDIDSDTGHATWVYTIKPAATISSVGVEDKIYIPENMKNGEYKLKIYTPPVEGAISVDKKTYSTLCDRKEVTFTVEGSATDDLNSHGTQ